MNFLAEIKTVNSDFANVFFASYLKGEWGIKAGFKTIPPYIAIMRKRLADWQAINDCDNALCANVSTTITSCPVGYTYVPADNGKPAYCSLGGCPPGTQPIGTYANGTVKCLQCACPIVYPTLPDVIMGPLCTPNTGCECDLNPQFSGYGHNHHHDHLNVNEIIINTFGR